MPLWVGRSQISSDVWQADCAKLKAVAKKNPLEAEKELNYQMRCWVRKTEALPKGMAGVKGLFNSSGHSNRCQLQLHEDYVHRCIDGALREIENLQCNLENEYKQYWGDVGVNKHVQTLKQLMLKAWNWAGIIQRGGASSGVEREAFGKLAQHLEGILSKTTWPDSMQFPYVERKWPSVDTLIKQYESLAACVAFYSGRAPYNTRWFPIASYEA